MDKKIEFYKKMLEQNECEISFNKQQTNEPRTLRCTTQYNVLKKLNLLPSATNTTKKDNNLRVVDLDTNSWKSIKPESIKSFKILSGSLDHQQSSKFPIGSSPFAGVNAVNAVNAVDIIDAQLNIISMLNTSLCDVTFKKMNGQIRTMRCSLHPDVLSKMTNYSESQIDPKFSNADHNRVFAVDTDLMEWRSFLISNMQYIKIVRDLSSPIRNKLGDFIHQF
ncbi:MAG: hypothetical protein ACXW2E_00510 [Nitrososphaeraceae archaeon]